MSLRINFVWLWVQKETNGCLLFKLSCQRMSSTMKSLLVDEMTEGRSKKLKEHMQVDASTTLRREWSTYEEERFTKKLKNLIFSLFLDNQFYFVWKYLRINFTGPLVPLYFFFKARFIVLSREFHCRTVLIHPNVRKMSLFLCWNRNLVNYLVYCVFYE